MLVLLTKILMLYIFVRPMFKFKLIGHMYMAVPTGKSNSDEACSNTLSYLSIMIPIE